MSTTKPLSSLRFAKLELDAMYFHSAEQYYQYKKAEFLGEDDMKQRIKDAENPCTCRALGKIMDDLPSTSLKMWFQQAARDVMKKACTVKFQPESRMSKLSTENGEFIFGELPGRRWVHGDRASKS